MRKIITSLLFASMAIAASAGNPWTLSQCIDYALEHNIAVKQGEINVRQNEISLNTAKFSRLPGVNASASENFSFGRSTKSDNTTGSGDMAQSDFSIGVDVPVFQGFQIKHNIAVSKLNLAAATADLDKAKDDIRIAVAKAYVTILYNKEILKVAESQTAIDEMHVSRLEDMYATGKASAAQVAQQKAALAQSRYQETQAINNLKLAVLDLTQLLELDEPEGFDVVAPADEATALRLTGSAEDIYASAVTEKPSILAEQARLGAAKSKIGVAKSYLYPNISLSGGIGTDFFYVPGKKVKTPFFTQLNDYLRQYVGLSLSIPVFSRFQIRNGIRSAKLGYESQNLQLDNARKALYKEIQQAWYGAVASRDRFLSSEEVKRSAETSFELVNAKYEAGKATITEFNEAKNTLMKAEADLAQARYEHMFQTRLLDFYKGEEIDF